MGIFDLFTFKKEAGKVFSKENIKAVLTLAKDAIVDQVKANIPGAEKKAIVDAIVMSKIAALTATVTNKYVLFLINKIKDFVPTVTQIVYDFLKAQIENL